MGVDELLEALGPEIDDVEEETFSLFSQTIPSANLGFVDQHATSIDLTINGRDLTIHQSPTILSSSRGGGTTGAVLWKITPLLATWLTQRLNPLTTHHILSPSSNILELGCGISALLGLAVGPLVRKYTLTDQIYVQKLVCQNLEENAVVCKKGKGKLTRGKKGAAQEGKGATDGGNIEFKTLDWETDEVSNVSQGEDFDLVIAADCIYNSHLIPPLVATLRDACRLREEGKGKTVALIAQQLRSDEVLEEFLKEFNKYFRIWRVGDEWFKAVEGLGEVSGFVLHIGVLKD